jgi:AcrR family transcriptional regulator
MHFDEETPYQPRGAALALILATERLIAEHGSAGVSLREITDTAGAANSSAVQYHFGSREALLLAVFRYRMAPINARRLAQVEALERADRLLDQRGLIGALVHPLAEQLQARAEGNYYVRFLERCTREGLDDRSDVIKQLIGGWRRLEALLRDSIAYLPEAIVDFRVQLMMEHAVSGLASIEAGLQQAALRRDDVALHIELLIDACASMLSGPISAEALRLLTPVQSRGE